MHLTNPSTKGLDHLGVLTMVTDPKTLAPYKIQALPKEEKDDWTWYIFSRNFKEKVHIQRYKTQYTNHKNIEFLTNCIFMLDQIGSNEEGNKKGDDTNEPSVELIIDDGETGISVMDEGSTTKAKKKARTEMI